jgi:hypothetical protein
VLAAGMVAGMLSDCAHIIDVDTIKSETFASLGAFLLALVSVLALLKPTFFQSKSTF